MFAKKDYFDWDSQLPYIQWCINAVYHESLKDNPHFIMFLREPRFPFEDITSSRIFYNVESNYKSEMLACQKLSYDFVKANLESAKLKQKENYDRGAKHIRFNVGYLVLLHLPPVARHNKLVRIRWLGPYRVIRLMGNGINFEIRRVADGKTEIIHPNRLKPYVASQPWVQLNTKQFDGIKTDKPRKEVTWADDQGYNLTSSNTNISTTPILTNSLTVPLLDSPNPSIQTPILPVIDFLPPSDRRITFTRTIDNDNSIGTPDTSMQPLTPLPRTPRFPIPDNPHDSNYSDQPSPFEWTPPQQHPISLPPKLESQDSCLTPGIFEQSISIGSEERLMWDDYLGPEYPDSSPLTDSHALELKQLFVPVKCSSPMAKVESYRCPNEIRNRENRVVEMGSGDLKKKADLEETYTRADLVETRISDIDLESGL
ncbi:hypothetical protein QYM36_001636 [Artemia franciscana]|uniref:Polyprotein n=1 Tax=Artemia franciscana TaxID=6661 RepID=A0AA88IEK9_ARTSF|nr:hypothetical protein QYM36_001636 [Artemia franciscana]